MHIKVNKTCTKPLSMSYERLVCLSNIYIYYNNNLNKFHLDKIYVRP